MKCSLKLGLFIFLLISTNALYSQISCKVLMESISGFYDGDCKKGLAHGNGTAKGEDIYEGEFKRGYPDGTGTYTFKNGQVYTGEWDNGIKNGEGKLVIPTLKGDSTVVGYWRDDSYLGEKYIAEYKIIQKNNLERYSIKKMPGLNDNRVILKIQEYGGNQSGISDFQISLTSGIRNGGTNRMVIDYVDFPFEVNITYSKVAKLNGSLINVVFYLQINEPGTWEVTLINQ